VGIKIVPTISAFSLVNSIFFVMIVAENEAPRRCRGGVEKKVINVNGNAIVTNPRDSVKIAVWAPSGKRASPYSIADRVLIKRVAETHVFRAKQAVGIDESVWQSHRDRVDIVRFLWPDGRIFEIPAEEFEHKSFLHGDDITFARTRFVRISALKLVQERPPAKGQLPLFAGVGV
jgi:hypothetical protein